MFFRSFLSIFQVNLLQDHRNVGEPDQGLWFGKEDRLSRAATSLQPERSQEDSRIGPQASEVRQEGFKTR